MLSTQELALLRRCGDHVHELIELYESSGDKRPDLFSDLNRIDGLIGTSYRGTHADGTRWVDDVVAALEALGGKAHLSSITRECIRCREEAGRSVTRNSDATVRDTLHAHSSDAAKFHYGVARNDDLFSREYALGLGWWSLRSMRSRN